MPAQPILSKRPKASPTHTSRPGEGDTLARRAPDHTKSASSCRHLMGDIPEPPGTRATSTRCAGAVRWMWGGGGGTPQQTVFSLPEFKVYISAVYLLLQSGESSWCLKGLSCFSWHYGQNIIKTPVAGTELSVRERTWLKAFLQPRDFNFFPLLLPYPRERNITKNQDRDFSAKFISSSIYCNGDMFGFAACLLFAGGFLWAIHIKC